MENSLNLFESVVSDSIKDITPDILDAGVDQFIENGILKDLPLIGTGFKLYSLTQKISEVFYMKKVMRFLFQLKDIPKEKRMEFVKRIESGEDSKRAGETVLFILNRLDDINKATIVGRLFNASILGHITYSNFLRLSHIIDRAFCDDLQKLKETEFNYLDSTVKLTLYQTGLLTQKLKDTQEHSDRVSQQFGSGKRYSLPIIEYQINDFGKMLISYGF